MKKDRPGRSITSSKDVEIIIVDDMQFSRVVVQAALKKAGFINIRVASSAVQALNMMDEKHADVVLADWLMPEMDGLQLTDTLRQRDEERGEYTAIILFTAQEGIEPLVEAFNRGVDDYICKPPNPHELAARVNAAARIASLQNDLLETSRQLEETIRHLEDMALTDPLTGAGNRRLLSRQLEQHLLDATSRRGGVCFVMLDIDHFKKINDTHGHDVGDEILIGLTRRVRRTVRPTDLVARMGGEEFGVIMHYSNPENFKVNSLDRLLSSINSRPFKTAAGDISITASIGVCFYNGEGQQPSVQNLIKCADEKLYQAKANGRNQIVF
ncbi:MAG: two-component system, cell cycle response regulator [Pseudomonadota bacterium]|nr:two-component system, cell cycle response regulator [Pseudomonadota bacterium]